ncbi:MAG TPA: hypothetical protein VMG10_08725 [Gemmataceae bacterium]|nr:hypothetical protein [Gemmataceae bacterium]
MFTYRCPGCGKHHSVDKEFESTFEAKCLRCGAPISVTPDLLHQSQPAGRPSRSQLAREESITKSPGESSAHGAAKDASASATELLEPTLDAPSSPDDEPAPGGEPRKNGRAKSNNQPKDKDGGSGKKKPAKREDKQKEEMKQPEEKKDEAAPEPKRWNPPGQSPAPAKGPRPRWQLIAGGSAVALVLFLAIGFLIFGGSKKPSPKRKTGPKPVAKKTAPTPPPPKPVKKEAPIKIPDAPQLIICASRLSAELAADADLANSKYAGKLLEVSGLFGGIEKKEGLRPPMRDYAVFSTSGPKVSCDLQDSTPAAAGWRSRLQPNKLFTIRGKYEKNGYLRGCFLMPEYTSTADSRYKSRTIEVSGRVAKASASADFRSFPSVVLSGETNSVMEIHCLFRTTDAPEVAKIQPGTPVTIQGKCSGREGGGTGGHVRLDNCQLVYTSAPPEKIPRLDAVRLLREYEEDVRPDYIPPPGEEEQIDTIWTIRQLVKDHAADPKAFLKKTRNHILRVRGKPQPIGTGKKSVVVLTSGDTDLPFQVECHFTADAMEAVRLSRATEYRVRGLFTGKIDGKKLRLDNCRLDMPRVAGPELTEDYLPHKPGRAFAVDLVTFGVLIKRKIGDLARREVHVQGRDGVTEILVTHLGPLTGKSLFEEGVQQEWVQQTQARIRRPETSGIYYRRLHAGFVEHGTPFPGKDGKTEIAWNPIFKLHAQAGDKWKWDSPLGIHEYVLEKFDDYQGQPCAYIRELFTPVIDVLHPIETLHVYAKGLGEVESRQWRHLDQRGGKKLHSELKWVEKAEVGQNIKRSVKPAKKPSLPPAAPPLTGKPAGKR